MKKFALAGICTLALVGFVMADEFTATITKVEGTTVYFKKKAGFGGKKADPAVDVKEEKADATSDVKVAKGEFDIGAGGIGKKGGGTGKGAGGIAVKAGDPIEGGLKAERFTKIDEKGVFAQITTNDAGKITQILAVEFGAGGKKGGFTGKGGGFTGKGGKKGGKGTGRD